MTKRAKSPRLGTSNRAKQQRARGGESTPKQSVFSSYSPKADSDVMFSTLPRFLHFLFCEGEPSYRALSYSKRDFENPFDEYKTDAGFIATSVDQTGFKRVHILGSAAGRSDRIIELHEKILAIALSSNRTKSSDKCNGCLEFFAQEEINKKFETRIRNWFRAIPMVAQARNHVLKAQENFIHALLEKQATVSLAELQECENQLAENQGMLVASAIRGAGSGCWGSDLDLQRLSFRTSFGKVGKELS